MVNTRTDAELAAAVQAAVDAMLPQIREQVREEYRAGASGGNPPPATIHTWLERFNKQKPHSFEKAVAPLSRVFFLQFFPRAEQERLKREYHSIRQRASENSTEYMQRFLRLAGFLGQAAGTAEEQAKNFRWGLHKSILDHVMWMTMIGPNVQTRAQRVEGPLSPLHSQAVVVTTVTTITTTTLVTTTEFRYWSDQRNRSANPADLPTRGSQQSRLVISAGLQERTLVLVRLVHDEEASTQLAVSLHLSG
ncbi:zinc finger, CCHC-type, retrotransposon gag domain protein [Tanacetum coccineum]